MIDSRFNRFDYAVWGTLTGLTLAIALVWFSGDNVGLSAPDTYPPNGQSASAFVHPTITFLEPMQFATVETRFTITPSVPGRFDWPTDSQLTFIPNRALTPGERYTVTLAAGSLSAQGVEVLDDLTWQFTVRQPAIVYMSPAIGPRELYRLDAPGATPRPLTDTGGLIYDFDTATDGWLIAYGRYNEQNGIDVWLTDGDGSNHRMLVECGPDRCYDYAFSPDHTRIAFSRERAQAAAPNAPPRLWTVDLQSGEAAQVFQDNNILGYSPSWSPDGTKLAFFDGGEGAIRVLDLRTSQQSILPSWLGMMGAWSPTGDAMLFNDLDRSNPNLPGVVVYRVLFETEQVTPALTPTDTIASYSVPVWSPNGEWLAIAIQPTVGGPGAQLWLMRPDGSEARPIAADTGYTYGSYRWDPWGETVVYQRFQLSTPNATPEVLQWTLATGEVISLIDNATTPRWLP